MNVVATFDDEKWPGSGVFAVHNLAPQGGSTQGKTMTSAMAAFGIAVGGTSLICYVLMTRLQYSKRARRSSGGNSAPDGSNYAGGDGRTIAGWFGGDHSVTDSSGNPGDGGGGDCGGGGDGGGGDGGGGGD